MNEHYDCLLMHQHTEDLKFVGLLQKSMTVHSEPTEINTTHVFQAESIQRNEFCNLAQHNCS